MFTLFNKRARFISLLLFFVCISFSYLMVDVHQDNSAFFSPSQLGLLTLFQYSFAAILMLIVWYQFNQQAKGSESTIAIRHVLWVAILARVILLPLPSYTSNDMSRYLFDGQIVLNGLDPYRVTHEAPVLQAQRALWNPPAEQAKYVTIYPPVALVLYTSSAAFGHIWGPFFWKFLLTLASIGTLWLGYLLLKQANKLQHLPLLALSPLLILEAGVGAHIDTFSTLAVCAALWAWQNNRACLCGFFIGLGVLLKLTPILLLGPLFFAFKAGAPKKQSRCDKGGWHQLSLVIGFRMGFSAVVTISSVYLVTILSGFQAIGSLQVFFQKWRFGSPLFSALEAFLNDQQLLVTALALIALGLFVIAIISWVQFLRNRSLYKHDSFVPLFQWVLALPLFISPVVFPWYLMPFVPLLALSPNIWLLAWTCLLPFTYEVLGPFASQYVWLPAVWPLIAVACGVVLGIFLPLIQKTIFKHNHSSSHTTDVRTSINTLPPNHLESTT